MLAFLVKYPRLLSSHALPSPLHALSSPLLCFVFPPPMLCLLSSHALPSPIQCFAFSPPVLCLLSSYASPSPLLCFARAKF